jgi:hypothetical protein
VTNSLLECLKKKANTFYVLHPLTKLCYLKALGIYFDAYYIIIKGKGKGKAVPLQTWSGPEGSRKLRFTDFMTTAQNGGKVVSLTHRPPLPPGNTPGINFY